MAARGITVYDNAEVPRVGCAEDDIAGRVHYPRPPAVTRRVVIDSVRRVSFHKVIVMKRGKDVRNPIGKPLDPHAPREITVLQFVMVEKSPGAFTLRFVSNDDLLRDLHAQGALRGFLDDAEALFRDFRSRIETTFSRPIQ